MNALLNHRHLSVSWISFTETDASFTADLPNGFQVEIVMWPNGYGIVDFGTGDYGHFLLSSAFQWAEYW